MTALETVKVARPKVLRRLVDVDDKIVTHQEFDPRVAPLVAAIWDMGIEFSMVHIPEVGEPCVKIYFHDSTDSWEFEEIVLKGHVDSLDPNDRPELKLSRSGVCCTFSLDVLPQITEWAQSKVSRISKNIPAVRITYGKSTPGLNVSFCGGESGDQGWFTALFTPDLALEVGEHLVAWAQNESQLVGREIVFHKDGESPDN